MAQVPPAAPAASAAASRPPSTEYSQRFSTQDRHRAEATKRYLEDKYTKMRIQEKERRDRYVFICIGHSYDFFSQSANYDLSGAPQVSIE